MIEKEPQIFYKLYPYDHWLNKANMLKFKIDSGSTAYDDIGVYAHESNDERYQRMLKYELHFTYFQQVEAIFELLFALQNLDDKHIWIYLSQANGRENYSKIKSISEGELDLDEQKVHLTNGKTRSFLEWAFYAGNNHQMHNDELRESINKSNRLLKQAATDFVDRESYNSYKHGLRVLPLLDEVGRNDPRIAQKFNERDFANSFTYLENNNKRLSEVTVTYDSNQDMERISFLSHLVMNMITMRRVQFYKEDIMSFTRFSKMDPVEKINASHQKIKHIDTIGIRYNKPPSSQ
ncbi:hypothetical protein [Gracilimonas sp.]|uniref:hypothetical protein n=1 Tax=Gracilimonas sp. TaxID=1974203 RepID=UPI003BAA08D1